MSAGDNYLKWKQRAEQAERELDWARGEADGIRTVLDAERTARERAEADNAALLEAYRRTWGCVMHDNVVHSPACNGSNDALGICTPECPALRVSSLLKADHPGAALLAYVKGLTSAMSTAQDLLGESSDNATKAWRVLNDALKERKP